VPHAWLIIGAKSLFDDLKLSHNTTVTHGQTDRHTTTIMPIARPLSTVG